MIKQIINLAIVAHIDHGKSTFSSALINICNKKEKIINDASSMDSHCIEKRRGVTIRNHYRELEYQNYIINLIDTPGHYDFKHYVDIGITLAENIVMLIDISKGIQAQNIKYLNLAIQKKCNIFVVLNKIDLQLDEIYKENIKQEIIKQWNINQIFEISAKNNTNIENLMNYIAQNAHKKNYIQNENDELEFIILDIEFLPESARTKIWIKILSGYIQQTSISINNKKYKILSIENIKNNQIISKHDKIYQNKFCIFYIMGNLSVSDNKHYIGQKYSNKKLNTYIQHNQPSIFCQLKPKEGLDKFEKIEHSVKKIILTDQSVHIDIIPNAIYCKLIQLGFYGMFHKEIFMEKLEISGIKIEEVNFNYIYKLNDTQEPIYMLDQKSLAINYRKYLQNIIAPFLLIRIQFPHHYYNEIINKIRLVSIDVIINNSQVIHDNFILFITIPEFNFLENNFVSLINGITNGHAIIIIDEKKFIKTELSILELYVNGHPIEEYSRIILTNNRNIESENIMKQMTQIIDRQQYELKIQILIDKKIYKSQIIKPFRKDVTAKCYGGDSSRKRKLIKKQNLGKHKLSKNFDIKKFKSNLIKK